MSKAAAAASVVTGLPTAQVTSGHTTGSLALTLEGGAALTGDLIRSHMTRLHVPTLHFFHRDAVQALGRVSLELARWGVDLATLSAHKLGGPVGVGVLVRRGAVPLRPLLTGGEQEAINHRIVPPTIIPISTDIFPISVIFR